MGSGTYVPDTVPPRRSDARLAVVFEVVRRHSEDEGQRAVQDGNKVVEELFALRIRLEVVCGYEPRGGEEGQANRLSHGARGQHQLSRQGAVGHSHSPLHWVGETR